MKNYLITENQLKFLIKYIINEETEAEKLRKEAEKQFFKQREMEDDLFKMMKNTEKEKLIMGYKVMGFQWRDKKTNEVYMSYSSDSQNLYIGIYLKYYFKRKYNFHIDELRPFFKEAVSKYYDLKIDGIFI